MKLLLLLERELIRKCVFRCEPFDTYPRTYDLLHAANLFSVERKRYCVS